MAESSAKVAIELPARSPQGAGRREVFAGPETILNALPDPVFAVDETDAIAYANPAAEQFFRTGMPALIGRRLDRFLPADSPLFGLIAQVRKIRARKHRFRL